MATEKLGLPTITGNMTADVVRDINALATAVDGKSGVANGLATLGADGKVPADQLNVQAPADASTTVKGIVMLEDSTSSTSIAKAATPKSVKSVNDALTSHKSDGSAHGIGDKNTLLTTNKATIVGAMNELFTNVSNGKELVGTAITDADNDLTVPAEPTFQQLADLIGEFGGKRKWASGNAVSSSTTESWVYADGTSSPLLASITVTGLSFQPSIILVFVGMDTGATGTSSRLSVLFPEPIYSRGGQGRIIYTTASTTTSNGNGTMTLQLAAPASISQGGFKMIAGLPSTNCRWYAFE